MIIDDALLDRDPLGARLHQVVVPALSEQVRAAILAGPRVQEAHRPPLRLALILGLAVALLVVLMTPVSATLERAVLPTWLQQRLGIVGAAAHPSAGPGGAARTIAPSVMPCSKAAQLHGNALCYPDLSLADAQRQVDFPIPIPARIPSGLTFRGALVASPHSVAVYWRDHSEQKAIGVWITEGTPTGGSAFPLGAAQTVDVNKSSAVYVHGSYEDDGPGTVARWNPNADDAELIWQHGGFTYDMTAHGLHASSEDLIAIAESLP